MTPSIQKSDNRIAPLLRSAIMSEFYDLGLSAVQVEAALSRITNRAENLARGWGGAQRFSPPVTSTIRQICRDYHVTPEEVLSRSRYAQVTEARQAVMYALTIELGLSSVRIGQILKRDHSTVLHGVRIHRERKEAREEYRRQNCEIPLELLRPAERELRSRAA